MKPSPPRIPKGSKEGGQFKARWRVDLERGTEDNSRAISNLWIAMRATQEKIGTSTPLIIWNIAVLIALALLGLSVAKLYGVAPY